MITPDHITPTTCPYCGVGCNLELHVKDDYIYKVTSPFDSVVNQGLPLFEELIRRGIASGEFREIDAGFAAKAMIGPMLLAVIWKTVLEPIGADTLDIVSYAAQHAEIFLKGIQS